jgi:hypothetical protein
MGMAPKGKKKSIKKPDNFVQAVPARNGLVKILTLNSLLKKSRTDTAGTRLDSFHSSRLAIYAPNFLKIWVPRFYALIVRVTHLMAHNRFFPTYLTDSRHTKSPL